MPAYVSPDSCDGCDGRGVPRCVEVCPSDIMQLDIMQLDPSIGRAHNIEPDLCWECYACVKTCPQTAIAVRGYADVVPLGGDVTPEPDATRIAWTVRFRNGEIKRFEYPTRTSPPGSIELYSNLPLPRVEELKQSGLCGHATRLHPPSLPTATCAPEHQAAADD